jgi:hypothetical protein
VERVNVSTAFCAFHGRPSTDWEALQSVYTAAAHRASDAVTLHALAGSAGKYAALSLLDGSPSPGNVAYDSQLAAIAALGWNRDRFAVVFIPPDGMPPREAEAVLTFARQRYDAGFRYADPNRGYNQPDISMPALPADRARQIRLLTQPR